MVFPANNLAYGPGTVFLSKDDSQDPPKSWLAVIDYMKEMSSRYPRCYFIWWDRASSLSDLADVIRGGQTSEKIPGYIWKKRFQLADEAMACLNIAIELSPENYRTLEKLMHYHWQNQEEDLDMQQDLIDRVHKIDPRNTTVEVDAIFSHTVGYDSLANYLRMFDAAARYHKGDARALAAIIPLLYKELYRQVGWKRMTEDEAYKKPNPLRRRFLDLAAQVYAAGENLKWTGDWEYYNLARATEAKLLAKWEADPQNSAVCFNQAKIACQKHDWQRSYTLGKRALPDIDDDDNKQWCYYYITKSLWQMKNYDEAMKIAREAIMKWPGKQMPLYMYAIEGEESGKNLQAAYDCAYRAVEIDNTNMGCNDTFEKLRTRLKKPEHPRLIEGSPI